MIKISELEKVYRTEEVETVALNKLSIEVKEGEEVRIAECRPLSKTVSFVVVEVSGKDGGGN